MLALNFVSRQTLGRQFGSRNFGVSTAVAGATVLWVGSNAWDLFRVRSGTLIDYKAGGRLHAFQSTCNGDSGTWKEPINLAIGGIYLGLGTIGENEIGNVFSSEDMQKEMSKSVEDHEASKLIAAAEYQYWCEVQADNVWDVGGFLGTRFGADTRHRIQTEIANVMAYTRATE